MTNQEIQDLCRKYHKPNPETGFIKDFKTFFDSSIEKHRWLVDLLGNETSVFKYDGCDKNKVVTMPQNLIESYQKEIFDILPNYCGIYKLPQSMIAHPQISVENRVFNTIKHISTYANKTKETANIVKLNKLLSRLGKDYCKFMSSPDACYITVCTNPMAFLMLGSYGIDVGSCFAFNLMNRDKRYTVAEHDHSFILAISKDEPVIKDGFVQNITGRAIGFLHTKKEYLIITNLRKIQSNITRFLAEKLIGTSKFVNSLTSSNLRFKGGLNYHDNDAIMFFPNKESITDLTVNFTTIYSEEFHHGNDYYGYKKNR